MKKYVLFVYDNMYNMYVEYTNRSSLKALKKLVETEREDHALCGEMYIRNNTGRVIKRYRTINY